MQDGDARLHPRAAPKLQRCGFCLGTGGRVLLEQGAVQGGVWSGGSSALAAQTGGRGGGA